MEAFHGRHPLSFESGVRAMGGGKSGLFKGTYGSRDENEETSKQKGKDDVVHAKPDKNGYFGTKSKQSKHSWVRHLKGDEQTARQFFEEQTRGYIYEDVKSNGTIVREMPDGTRYSYRNFSHSDNTPVVEIWGVWPARQKIHFIGKE